MKSSEIRLRFLKFFEKRGHSIIPSASLVPENDPSVLFNTAGMQPLVPYLLGQKHPMGTRIADVQKCVRTGDLDDIGDNRHFSFFEMLGNWSLGDYFKEEAIKWSYDFLFNGDDKEEGDKGLGLDSKRLYVTIFEGDESAPFDEESKKIWMSLGVPEHRIYALPADDNFWSPGDNGPCGPCSEMFYDMVGNVRDLNKEEFIKATKEEKVIEIWNDVFMEYEKKDGKVIGKLSQKNVDTGAGLERMTAVMQGKMTAYDTDIFKKVLEKINELITHEETHEDIRAKRIILDHIRTSMFMIDAGVIPSNSQRGYILRRLLRRAIMQSRYLGVGEGIFEEIIYLYIDTYKSIYPSLLDNMSKINEIIEKEKEQFTKTLANAIKKLWGEYFYNDLKTENQKINADVLFYFFTTEGFPPDLTLDQYRNYRKEKNLPELSSLELNEIMSNFNNKMEEHQKLSQTASAGMFKGGLANHNERTVRLHTAHHLLLAALQNVVSKDIKQRGSNITEERLRMDFLCDHKLTDEEKKKVEDWVNEKIKLSLNVIRREMPLAEAQKLGAEMEFGAKYPEVVSVYFIGPSTSSQDDAVSIEFCGGPHVKNTSELASVLHPEAEPKGSGPFKILKEEAVAQGIRRIKAVLL